MAIHMLQPHTVTNDRSTTSRGSRVPGEMEGQTQVGSHKPGDSCAKTPIQVFPPSLQGAVPPCGRQPLPLNKERGVPR